MSSQKPDSLIRDLYPSKRHRTFPSHFYAYDMDFIEYDRQGNPVGAFEYKHGNMMNIYVDEFEIKCHLNSANLMNIPFFIVQYFYYDKLGMIIEAKDSKDIIEAYYYLIPVNSQAKSILPTHQQLSEFEFVQLLSAIRKETYTGNYYSKAKLNLILTKIWNYK